MLDSEDIVVDVVVGDSEDVVDVVELDSEDVVVDVVVRDSEDVVDFVEVDSEDVVVGVVEENSEYVAVNVVEEDSEDFVFDVLVGNEDDVDVVVVVVVVVVVGDSDAMAVVFDVVIGDSYDVDIADVIAGDFAEVGFPVIVIVVSECMLIVEGIETVIYMHQNEDRSFYCVRTCMFGRCKKPYKFDKRRPICSFFHSLVLELDYPPR